MRQTERHARDEEVCAPLVAHLRQVALVVRASFAFGLGAGPALVVPADVEAARGLVVVGLETRVAPVRSCRTHQQHILRYTILTRTLLPIYILSLSTSHFHALSTIFAFHQTLTHSLQVNKYK